MPLVDPEVVEGSLESQAEELLVRKSGKYSLAGFRSAIGAIHETFAEHNDDERASWCHEVSTACGSWWVLTLPTPTRTITDINQGTHPLPQAVLTTLPLRLTSGEMSDV
jgi:hypothetical protein